MITAGPVGGFQGVLKSIFYQHPVSFNYPFLSMNNFTLFNDDYRQNEYKQKMPEALFIRKIEITQISKISQFP